MLLNTYYNIKYLGIDLSLESAEALKFVDNGIMNSSQAGCSSINYLYISKFILLYKNSKMKQNGKTKTIYKFEGAAS